jgi:predicted RNA-binding Zn-ribbon protein involved in translation (DUF1610 family)
MFAKARRFIDRFFRKSRSINNKPLNPLSTIVIIIVDLFILFNVFSGLDNISQWHLSPAQAYPCQSEWKNYRDSKQPDRDYRAVVSVLDRYSEKTYAETQTDRLGTVSPICLSYAALQQKIYTPENRKTQQSIAQKYTKIFKLEQENKNIRSQYDSTLLEKIAGQKANNSINNVSAEKAKQTLDQNTASIAALKLESTALKDTLTKKPESINLLNFIRDNSKYQEIDAGYQQAVFWYPSIQLAFQALFLVPLIAIALTVHNIALRKNAGLVALISWHLLVIFFIPLILKIFEFLQVGALFKFLFDIVSRIFGGLLFLVNYLYIFLIPLIGFTIVKISQKFFSGSRSIDNSSLRFQNQMCLNCAKKIRLQDPYCPHCGVANYVECQNCHEFTYKHLPHCKQCGHIQDLSDRLSLDNIDRQV